jgi:hypothetical protein
LIAENPPSIFNSSSGMIRITSMSPISGLKKNRRNAGIARRVASAMMGETFTRMYELAMASTSELMTIPTSRNRVTRRCDDSLLTGETGKMAGC